MAIFNSYVKLPEGTRAYKPTYNWGGLTRYNATTQGRFGAGKHDTSDSDQCGWWYTYPSEKWWSSSIGMMTFPEISMESH